MAFFRNFNPNENSQFKIGHRLHEGYKVIGDIIEINEDLNICKISFTDVKGKNKKIWFHLFTGNAVTLPKSGQEWAEDVPSDSEKAYYLTGEPIYIYDIDPAADMFYQNEQLQAQRMRQAEESESKKNSKVDKIN